jgi:DNA-binding winged helix-turn-helix (wHTH) protein
MLYCFGEFALNSTSCELHRAGEPVPLQRRVFDLIVYLVEHPDRLVTKKELLERVWDGVAVSDASLSQAVKQARRALEDDADDPSFIATVRGRGYRFVGALTRLDTPPARVSAPIHWPWIQILRRLASLDPEGLAAILQGPSSQGAGSDRPDQRH